MVYQAMDKLTLMSLFDGSGGFPLAAQLCGIEPISASEIEPFPLRVTTKRFPQIKHYGDIREINGGKVPPVDIITAGFPCQDLSVAGGRAGLAGERSALFYHIPRVVKEMRLATGNAYPRYVVLENVPGLLNSAKGLDFQEVLNQLVKIKDETLSIPLPKKGRWATCGEIVADGFSVAWRTLDAQYFGVRQRRRRIFIVADFRGERAGDVLFEHESLSRNFTPSAGARQGTAGKAEDCTGATIILEPRSQDGIPRIHKNIIPTLNTAQGGQRQPCVVVAFEPGAVSRLGGHFNENLCGTLCTHAGDNQVAVVMDTSYVLQGNMIGRKTKNGPNGNGIDENLSFTLTATDRHAVVYENYQYGNYHENRTTGTIRASGGDNGGGSENLVVEKQYHVRRLTPLECGRLQGFPDQWCDDLGIENPSDEEILWWTGVFETHRKIVGTATKPKSRKQIIKWLKNPYSDAAEYRMWGNGIALPCAIFVLNGFAAEQKKGEL